MKTQCGARVFHWLNRLVWIIFLCFAIGCQTISRTEWDARVGRLSYDQAVLELGPPDKFAELSDGRKVGEWLVQKGAPTATYIPGPPMRGVYWGNSGAWHYMPPGADWYLQLVFSPDGILETWKQVPR